MLKNFSDRLRDLMFDHNLSAKKLSENLDHNIHDIYHWKSGKGKFMPSVANIIKLADYFRCSIGFLLGLEEENHLPDPKRTPPFSQRFRFAVESNGYSLYKLGVATQMGTAQYYAWIHGQSKPSIYSLINIASVLGCSIDYLLGRE